LQRAWVSALEEAAAEMGDRFDGACIGQFSLQRFECAGEHE
jgi:hypothetical protein